MIKYLVAFTAVSKITGERRFGNSIIELEQNDQWSMDSFAENAERVMRVSDVVVIAISELPMQIDR